MGLEFIQRTLRTFGIVLLIGLPFGLYYAGFWNTLAFLSGGVWGMLNLMLITSMVRLVVRPEGADKGRVIAFSVIKFPALYAAGFFLLKVPQFEPMVLLMGFTALLLIIVLKALGRLLLGIDLDTSAGKTVGGTVA